MSSDSIKQASAYALSLIGTHCCSHINQAQIQKIPMASQGGSIPVSLKKPIAPWDSQGGGGRSGPPVPPLYLPMWTTYGFGSRWICWVPKLKTRGPEGPEALTWYWATMNIYINGIKCITSDIWPSLKEDQGQPRIIICTILVGPTLPILHTKSKAHQPSGSYEEDF